MIPNMFSLKDQNRHTMDISFFVFRVEYNVVYYDDLSLSRVSWAAPRDIKSERSSKKIMV